MLRMTLLGIGAMASPRYRPAGLLVEYGKARVMIDGGPRAAPAGRLDRWLVTDARCELMPAIRRLARRRGIEPGVGRFERGRLSSRRAASRTPRIPPSATSSARRAKVKRLVFAHIGRSTIRALDRGERFPFGELGKERHVY